MADDSFSLPGSSYKQIEKIITSYSAIGDETGPAEVASLAGTDVTNVSRNNKFLVATGLIQGKQKKGITPLGQKLAKAIEFDQEETQTACWSEIVERTEFLQKIISAVRIRRGMDSASLVNHIAFSAGAAKNAATMAGAGAVLEIFLRSKSLTDEGGVLVVPKESQIARPESENVTVKSPVNRFSDTLFQSPTVSGSLFSDTVTIHQRKDIDLTVNINLQVQCKIEELDEVGPKIRKLIAQLRDHEATEGEDLTLKGFSFQPKSADQE